MTFFDEREKKKKARILLRALAGRDRQITTKYPLRQDVRRGDDLAEGLRIDGARRIAGAETVLGIDWASRQFAIRATSQVGLEVGANRDGCALLALFQGPLLLRGVNQAEVVDAGILLRGRAGFDEVGDRDGGQQTDDGDNDHDFNEGKTRLAINFVLHIYDFLSTSGVNTAKGGLYLIHSCPLIAFC